MDEERSRAYHQLEFRLHNTHLESQAMLCLDGADRRTQEITTLLHAAPRLERGTWHPVVAVDFDSQPQLFIEAHNHPIEIPVDSIVDAATFISWNGRGVGGRTKKVSEYDDITRTSAATIDYYVSLGAGAPPVEEATGFVQPNGLVFYAVDAGSHRAAAAIKRGDEMLSTVRLNLYELQADVFDIPTPDLAQPG